MFFVVRLFILMIISYLIVDIIMPYFINFLKKYNVNQETSEYALEDFKNKEKTPIMGGLLFVITPIIVYLTINFRYLDNNVLAVILTYGLFCLVGFVDDYLIITKHNNNGLSAILKLLIELLFVLFVYFLFKDVFNLNIDIPFINGGFSVPSLLFIIFMIISFLGEANAANFTDGMDGLCASVSIIGIIFFMVISYVNNYRSILMFLFSVLGSLFGYLKYNKAPAKIFMGDSGSLAIGGLFACVAFIMQKEIALLFIGFVFLWEMLCVCIQQVSVRAFHKKVFPYTPIHYNFLIKGMKQDEVIKLFCFIAFISGIVGLFLGLM